MAKSNKSKNVPAPPSPPPGRKIREGKNPPLKPESKTFPQFKQVKAYTEKEVIKALKEQIVDCAKKIDADNLSVYTARKKIYETKLVKI